MKLIAYYLPQFHEIPENNQFWGGRFTEWVNVKSARPLYPGHDQPRVPYHNNYYDLSEPGVMAAQMKLAKSCGIYGFCFYHYWFHGHQLLEKPVDAVLENSECKLNYCLCWANEPWTTTWHTGGGQYKVLMEQEYGHIQEWTEHFLYFLKFFKDPRYIKVGNKPMLLIYNMEEIPCRGSMFAVWDKMARDAGFDGVYLVSMRNSSGSKTHFSFVSATADFEPKISMLDSGRTTKGIGRWKNRNGYKYAKTPIIRRFLHTTFDYDRVNRAMLARKRGKNEFRCVFPGYDDTPRRREWSVIFGKTSPKKFYKYLLKNMKKSAEEGKAYLFINAWNEWGEGAYLEPDERHGYAYLYAVKRAARDFNQIRGHDYE